MQTMVSWVDALLSQQGRNKGAVSILDVGTGNALLLLQLAKLGYKDLTGTDYSFQSIALSTMIVQRHEGSNIRLVVSSYMTFLSHSFKSGQCLNHCFLNTMVQQLLIAQHFCMPCRLMIF